MKHFKNTSLKEEQKEILKDKCDCNHVDKKSIPTF